MFNNNAFMNVTEDDLYAINGGGNDEKKLVADIQVFGFEVVESILREIQKKCLKIKG